jgi:autophagy-related protein 13
MHQNHFSRHPPVTASPATNEQTNPTRTNNPRDRDVQALRTNSPLTQGFASSEEFGNNRQDQPQDNPAAQMQRLNQVIQNFHTKAALIILHSRVELSPAYTKANADVKRINKWFNIELDETDDYREDIKRWRTCDLKDDRPPPLVIEVFLTTDPLHQGQRLVIIDDDGKRWDVQNALSSSYGTRAGKRRATDTDEVLLERWTIELGDQTSPLPNDLTTQLPLVYKKSIVLFRSLFTYCNFLPAWKLGRRIGKSRSTMAMKIGYRIVDGHSTGSLSRSDNLILALSDSSNDVTGDYTFGVTESPAGPFSVRVVYRHNCEFRVDDSEELLSSRLLGADDDLFQPSIRGDTHDKSTQEVGSLPDERRQTLFERPELGHAYGSLGTFHQAGFASGTSPISALRSAQDYTTGGSPPTPEPVRPHPQPQQLRERESSKASLRAQAATRRSSFSFQPFKTPTLSASPLGVSPLGTSPRAHVPVLGSLTEEGGLPPPNAPALAARKPGSLASEHAVASSSSSSPKPAPVTRYSSSFSHRRARQSSGGNTAKTDDDQGSSGRGSATSSNQPGSGLMTEAKTQQGGSSGSVQEDGENIEDFLKLLETKKDLLTPEDATAEAATRRTAAALNRFHRMKESNSALSDSMSSSLMLQRSSTSSSRQLNSVPAMVPASTSSSPGKPISPHTPHTPFAPSRLSAAYSQDDTDTQNHLQIEIEDQPPSPSDAATSDTAQAHSTTNVPAIDIPTSPRPFIPNYRRSSSAQRQRPLPQVDDIADLYGMRSASMGAHERQRRQDSESVATPTRDEPPADLVAEPDNGLLRPDTSPRLQQARPHSASVALAGDGAGSESGSARSSAHVYRSRVTRGVGRGVTPPQGSTSSFERTDRSGADSGSISGTGSWRRRGSLGLGRPDLGGRNSRGSAEEEAEGEAEDEFLPFAMERSEFERK